MKKLTPGGLQKNNLANLANIFSLLSYLAKVHLAK